MTAPTSSSHRASVRPALALPAAQPGMRDFALTNRASRVKVYCGSYGTPKGGCVMQFVIIAEHSPEFCPTSNSKIRELMKEGAKEIPNLAKNLGIDIITLNV